MTTVALYPLTGVRVEEVCRWWRDSLPKVLQNGAAGSAFSLLARSVVVAPLPTPMVIVTFDSAADASKGQQDVQRFWQAHGIGKLGSPAVAAVASPTCYGPDPNAMMVWCSPRR
jgi:hypothetical protein